MDNKNKEKLAQKSLQLSWRRSIGIREVIVFFAGFVVGLSAFLFG